MSYHVSGDPERDVILRDLAEAEAQIRDLLEEREELLTEIRRLRMGNHPAGRALRRCSRCGVIVEWGDEACECGERPSHEGCDCTELCSMGPTCPGGMLARLPGSGCWRTDPDSAPLVAALAEALTERDAGHEGGEGA